MPALVLPVGHDLGAFHAGDGRPPVGQVRRGAALVELTAADFRVWSLAHGLPDEADAAEVAPCTEDLLLDQTDAGTIDALRDRGLLAVVDPESGDAVRFAETHRLLPLALGLGNTAEQPWLFSVGLLYQPVALMAGALFDLWQWAHLAPNLWAGCQEVATVAERAGISDVELTDPRRVLAGALSSLHQLLAVRVTCLDARIGVGA